MRNLRSRLYIVLVVLYAIAGIGFDAVVLASAGMWRYEPLNLFRELLDQGELSFLYLIAGFAALIVVGALIYIVSLDPFRAERPWGLVYLNIFPASLYTGVVLIPLSFKRPDMTEPLQIATVALTGFALPMVAFMLESFTARTLLSFGRRFDEKGWKGAAYFCLKNSLRWRPSVHETARRCGLLLAESERYKPARGLLERLGPIATSDDLEVIKALELVYQSEGESLLALRCVQRHRALRPHTKGIDLKVLDLCLALEQWEDAIEILESGRIELGLEKLSLLQQLYAGQGRMTKAVEIIRKMAEKEQPPYPKARAAARDLLRHAPDHLETMTELGLLLQKAQLPEELQEGAGYLERVLEREPGHAELRHQLAEYYQRTMQFQSALAHYRLLIERLEADASVFLGCADILKSESNPREALEIYQKMRRIFPDDWRAYHHEAEILFLLGHLEEAEALLQEGRRRLPDASAGNLAQLAKKIEDRRNEIKLQEITDELARVGDDPERRIELIGLLLNINQGEQALAEADLLLEKNPELLDRVQKVVEEGMISVMSGFRLRDYLADLHFRQGRYDKALAMQKMLAAESLHPEQVLEQACKTILSRAPDLLPARMELADVYRRTEQWEEAMKVYEPLLSSPPADERLNILTRWVEAAYRAGRVAEAREKGLELLPDVLDRLPFLLMLIHILEDAGDYHQAYDVYKLAAGNFPEDETLHAMRRTVADNKKRDRMEALQARAEAHAITHAEHYEKAELHREFNQIRQAIIHFQLAAQDPELREIAMARMAICLCDRRLFDMADETLDGIALTRENTTKFPELKSMVYWVAETLEQELLKPAALKYYKRIFHVDAAFRDVVSRLEKLDGA